MSVKLNSPPSHYSGLLPFAARMFRFKIAATPIGQGPGKQRQREKKAKVELRGIRCPAC